MKTLFTSSVITIRKSTIGLTMVLYLLLGDTTISKGQEAIPSRLSQFTLTVDAAGMFTVGGTQQHSLLSKGPEESDKEFATRKGLYDLWNQYYRGFINGDQKLLKKYSVNGEAPIVPSRQPGGSGFLEIYAIRERGGAIRLILHWTLFIGPEEGPNGRGDFYDCHIWSKTKDGDWRVQSMLYQH